MKKSFAIIGLILCFGIFLSCSNDNGTESGDQSNPPDENVSCGFENEYINTQSAIDNFTRREVHGTLYITGGLVQDLSGLSDLTFIGKLVVQNTNLTSLAGLDNLITLCDGEIELINNIDLEDVSALSNIGTQITNLTIKDCPALEDTGGLNMNEEAIELIMIRSGIKNLNSFTNLDKLKVFILKELPNLNSISGLLGIQEIEHFEFRELPMLSSLSGLDELAEVLKRVDLYDVGIQNLNGLSQLKTIGHSLNIVNCESLISLEGLGQLTSVGNIINLHGIPLVENFQGLSQLSELEGLDISELESLDSFEGLSGITSLTSLVISTCPQISSLVGLWGLTSIDSVTIWGCEGLTTLQGLQNLETIREYLKISNCVNLQNLDVLMNTMGSIGGNNPRIELHNLPNLQSIQGLQHFKANRLIFSSLPNLTSLNGLGEITLLREMSFENIGITDLSGLSHLESLHYVNVVDCNALESLDGSPVQGDAGASENYPTYIVFENNTLLSDYCGFTTLANYSPYIEVECTGNAYNPTLEQIQSPTECSQ